MAWVEDRWFVTVTNDDGSESKKQSGRHGKGKRWRVRYEGPDGRERAKSFDRKPQADAFRSQTEADLLRGTYLDPDLGKITLRRWAHMWLERQTFDDSTRERVTSRVKRICDGLGDMRLAQLAASPSAVQAWVKGMKGAPGTVRGCFRTLSAICSAAVDDGRMGRNPCAARSIRLPEMPERKVRPLTPPQLLAIRAAFPPRWQAMVDAGASCGLRQGEILAFSPDDIDFLRRTVHVRRQVKILGNRPHFALPKRGKTRSIPLGGNAAVSFSEHIKNFPAVPVTLPWHEPGTKRHGKPETVDLLFTTRLARGVVTRQNLNARAWHPALEAASLPVTRENGMHLLRHTFASVLLENGVSIRKVAAYLGHDDPSFTLRVYAHLMPDSEEDARKAADLAFTVPAPDSERSGTR